MTEVKNKALRQKVHQPVFCLRIKPEPEAAIRIALNRANLRDVHKNFLTKSENP